MLKVRFDVNDEALRDTFLRASFKGALDTLRPEDPARWGRMTAQEMVEHLVWAFECSTGEIEVPCLVPAAKREVLRPFLHNNRPTPHEFMNPVLRDGLPALRFRSLDESRAALVSAVDRFFHHVRTRPDAVHTHPIFGPIGLAEWSRTHFKHCAHHLLQFGLLEVEPPQEGK